MLIDEFLPVWDERQTHSININAPIEAVWNNSHRIDLRKTCLTRFLFKLRGLHAQDELTLDELAKTGFVLLGIEPKKEILLGLTGKFWLLVRRLGFASGARISAIFKKPTTPKPSGIFRFPKPKAARSICRRKGEFSAPTRRAA